jgi:hypothetical protein
MNYRAIAGAATRLTVCIVLSVAFAFGIFKGVELRWVPPQLFEVWWMMGKYFAEAIAAVTPQHWIHGHPTSETYWPAATAAGLVLLSAVIVWALIIFVAWYLLRLYLGRRRRQRSNNAAQSDALRSALGAPTHSAPGRGR